MVYYVLKLIIYETKENVSKIYLKNPNMSFENYVLNWYNVLNVQLLPMNNGNN